MDYMLALPTTSGKPKIQKSIPDDELGIKNG